MTPELAWKAVVEQLRLEMSRATFDAWLAPARLLDFTDQVFTVGVVDPLNRDWLDSRLTSTLARLLAGILGTPVQVQFVVAPEEDELPEESSSEPEETSLEELDIQSVSNSIRSILTQPDRVVAVPKYLLRWLPLVGPDAFWLVIAFRQARFLHTTSTNRQKAFTARAEEIYRWCGMSRATFWRSIDRPELAWFVERLPQTGWGMDAETGRVKQNPNRYRIQVDIPITPMDAEALRKFLLEHDFENDPVAALAQAADAHLTDLIEFPPPRPTTDQKQLAPKAQTVEEVVLNLLPEGSLFEAEQQRNVQALAAQLSEKILRPLENFQLSWYFLEEWLPVLGAGPAALVALLRSYGYYNPISGELRDEIWIEGGYEEMAQVLGIGRVKTLVEWLPSQVNRGKQKDRLSPKAQQEKERIEGLRHNLAGFDQRIGYRPGQAGFAYQFKLKLDADPLVEPDETICRVLTYILSEAQQAGVMDHLTRWLQETDFENMLLDEKGLSSGFETLIQASIPDLRLSDGPSSGFETLSPILSSGFETLKDARVPVLRLIKLLMGLRTLKPILDSPASTACAEPNPEGKVWQLAELLEINHVSQKKREALLRREISGWPFVSWLLYAASSRGEAIKDPVGLAISKLLENPGEGAGGAYDRLAELPDETLRDLVWDELHWNRPTNHNWRQAMDNASRDRLQQLAEELGIEEEAGENEY